MPYLVWFVFFCPEPISGKRRLTSRRGSLISISSKLMGTIKAIQVREADRVKKGDLLVVLDPSQVQAQLRQVQAALEEAEKGRLAAISAREAARSAADLARATYERYRHLMKEASTSRQEYDEVQTRDSQSRAALSQADAALGAADSRVRQAKASAASAGITSRDAAVTAPFDGIVAARLVEVGSLASPGTPLLTLEGMEGYRVDLFLPESLIQRVAVNQNVKVTISALENTPFDGVVQIIVPFADEQSRSFLIKVKLPGKAGVRSGMFARVMIPVGEANILKIPASAVVVQGQLTGIYLLDDDQRARFRLIRTGRALGEQMEILSGLKEGDRYIIEPFPTLVDGAQIEAVE
ncbi:MAG: efflux RND transporter periplasmic adaptor subunit [Desulfobacterales bacterium]|nr:efflux RND transporter periplasmic adaptor subunit [Desulfobacterales bacterium]